MYFDFSVVSWVSLKKLLLRDTYPIPDCKVGAISLPFPDAYYISVGIEGISISYALGAAVGLVDKVPDSYAGLPAVRKADSKLSSLHSPPTKS